MRSASVLTQRLVVVLRWSTSAPPISALRDGGVETSYQTGHRFGGKWY